MTKPRTPRSTRTRPARGPPGPDPAHRKPGVRKHRRAGVGPARWGRTVRRERLPVQHADSLLRLRPQLERADRDPGRAERAERAERHLVPDANAGAAQRADSLQRRLGPDGGPHGRRFAEPGVGAFDRLVEQHHSRPRWHLHPVRQAARRARPGATYGDDVQDNTNFPLVRITNDATGVVTYARTHGWSSVSVAPGASSSTGFTLPDSMPRGRSTLVVVANGIASSPRTVTVS